MPINLSHALYKIKPQTLQNMTFTVKTSGKDYNIIGLIYNPNGHDLLRNCIKTIKTHTTAIKKDSEKPDLNISGTKYFRAFYNLSIVMLYLAEFRNLYKQQFEKTKPFKYYKKIDVKESVYNSFYTIARSPFQYREVGIPDRIEPLELVNTQNKNIRNKIEISYGLCFYDVLKRIEKIIGYELYYSEEYKCFLPKQFFTPVIFSSDAGRLVVMHLLNAYLPLNTFIYNNRRYANTLKVNYYTEGGQVKEVPKFYKNVYKNCTACLKNWEKKTKFTYNKFKDSITCPSCNNFYNNYKQPKWEIENIFHDGYHGSRSGFQFTICKEEHENSIPIGMELETEFKTKDLNKRKSDLIYSLWLALGKKDIVFERDGSLNSSGVECITNPMTVEYARKYWKPAKEILPKLTNGFYSGLPDFTQAEISGWWGIHLTFARKYWTDSALAKFVNFLHNKEHKDFIKAIAQRKANYGGIEIGESKPGKINKAKQFEVLKDLNVGPGEKIKDPTRMTTINLSKKNLVEVRMFQATNNVDEIIKNYEFVTSMHEFFMQENTQFITPLNDYLKWLCHPDKKERHIKYRYLIKYLQKDNFQIRYDQKIQTIPNVWIKYTKHISYQRNILF